ncbi:MAG: DUF2505 domain-containing protein [Brachybacterium sp.]|nr:DUF2505 domain-containing protein [Brachybacterium sp.]
MRIHENLRLPLSADDVPLMYADERYARLRASTLGADDVDHRVQGDPSGSFSTVTTLAMPTDRAPDIVRRFVGSRITVVERQQWQAPSSDGSRTGTTRLEVQGTPASMDAELSLRPAGASTSTVEIKGNLQAKVPLLGSRLEKAAAPYISEVLAAEQRTAERYTEGEADPR